MNRVLRVDCEFTAVLPAMSESRFAYRFTYDEAAEADALENEFFTVGARPTARSASPKAQRGRAPMPGWPA
jgi:hypothetical protein